MRGVPTGSGAPRPRRGDRGEKIILRPFSPRNKTILTPFLLVLAAAGAAAYAHWPALSARALSFDDSQYLTENELVQHPSRASAWRFLTEVRDPSTVRGYYQPLTMISLMLDHAAGGRPDDPRVFHRTSLALHVANVVLVVVLLYQLFGCAWSAALVGLLFGVHPLTVEPIPWVGERKTLLAAFFSLGSLVAYARYARSGGWRAYGACLVLYVLALLSKPTSTPLPAVMLLIDFWPLGRLGRRAVVEKAPFFALAVLFSAVTVVSQAQRAGVGTPGAQPAGHIPLILCHNIVFYLYKMVWPARLSSHYPFPQPLDLSDGMVLAGVIGTCVLIPALLVSLRWTRALLTGWLVFLVAILPTMGILGFTIVIAADKYAYLPAAGFLMILGWAVAKAWEAPGASRRLRRGAIVAAAVVAGALLTAGTRRHLAHWRDTDSLLNDMLSLTPRAGILHSWRGELLSRRGDDAAALGWYDSAIALMPNYAMAYNNRGALLARQKRYDEAMRDCTKAIELKPAYAEAYANRGAALDGKGDPAGAILEYSRAIEIRPTFALAYYNRANARCALGDHAGSIADYSRAIELRPAYTAAYYNRGIARARIGAFREAIADYSAAIRLAPDHAAAYNNRGVAHLALGDFEQAAADCTRAIEIRPNHASAYNDRAAAYYHLTRYDQAWADIEACRRLGTAPSAPLVKLLEEARAGARRAGGLP